MSEESRLGDRDSIVSPNARNENARAQAHEAMLDEMIGRLRESSGDATKVTLAAGVVGSLFRETAEAAKPGLLNNFTSNFSSTLKAGSRNVGYGYLTVTAGYLGNAAVDYGIGALTDIRLNEQQSAGMKMFDTISLSAAGIASMRYTPIKVMGAAIASHAAARMYYALDK